LDVADADDNDESENANSSEHQLQQQLQQSSLPPWPKIPTPVNYAISRNVPPSLPETSTSPLLESSPILAMNASDIARYLTAADQRAFGSISMFDYLSKLSGSGVEIPGSLSSADGGSGKNVVRGRIDLFVQRANSVSFSFGQNPSFNIIEISI
jgi:hypothetical protein